LHKLIGRGGMDGDNLERAFSGQGRKEEIFLSKEVIK
jgi:hypothetical protein